MVVEPFFERFDVIGAIRDVPMTDGIDQLARIEPGKNVLLGKMHLNRAIGPKRHVARIPFLLLKRRQPVGFFTQSQHVAIEPVKPFNIVCGQVDVVQLEGHFRAPGHINSQAECPAGIKRASWWLAGAGRGR